MKIMRRWLVVLAIVLVGCMVSVMQTSRGHTTRPEDEVQDEIDRERAIEVAKAHATKAQIDTLSYFATACEVRSIWRVYLEPAAGGDVWEYAIMKRGDGVVFTSTRWSGTAKISRPRGDSAPATIGQAEAIAIAKKDAQRLSDFSEKEMTVCELRTLWKIIYSSPPLINGGGREYLIDKRTGLITDKKYYQ